MDEDSKLGFVFLKSKKVLSLGKILSKAPHFNSLGTERAHEHLNVDGTELYISLSQQAARACFYVYNKNNFEHLRSFNLGELGDDEVGELIYADKSFWIYKCLFEEYARFGKQTETENDLKK